MTKIADITNIADNTNQMYVECNIETGWVYLHRKTKHNEHSNDWK